MDLDWAILDDRANFYSQDGTKMQIDSPAADVQSSKDIDEGLYSRQL